MPAAQQFNFARWYDPIFNELLGGLRDLVARVAAPDEGLMVLDIGCGTGTQISIYDNAGCKVHGIDLSAPMLEIAGSKLEPGAALSMGNALQIPYADQTFDLVISSLFIHQLKSGERRVMLEEALRVLKPAGKLVLVDFHHQDKRTVPGKLTYIFISIIEFLAGWEHFSNSRDFLSRGGIPDLATNLGVDIIKSIIVSNGNMGVYLLRQPD
jgi:ubiquinone/menaquinone biosynthesis C-methylase UbiE